MLDLDTINPLLESVKVLKNISSNILCRWEVQVSEQEGDMIKVMSHIHQCVSSEQKCKTQAFQAIFILGRFPEAFKIARLKVIFLIFASTPFVIFHNKTKKILPCSMFNNTKNKNK